MLGVTFLWTSIPPRGEQKLFSNFLIFFLIFNFLIFYYFYFIFLRGNRNFIKPMSSRSIYGGDRNTPKWHWFNEIKKYVCKLCENNLIFRSLVYSFIGYKYSQYLLHATETRVSSSLMNHLACIKTLPFMTTFFTYRLGVCEWQVYSLCFRLTAIDIHDDLWNNFVAQCFQLLLEYHLTSSGD